MPFEPFNIDNTTIHTWFERDRQHIELRNSNTERTILEFWDEEVTEVVEDGFLRRWRSEGDLHVQMYNLAHERGLLSKKAIKA